MVRHSGGSTVVLCGLHEWKRAYCYMRRHRRWCSNNKHSCQSFTLFVLYISAPQGVDHLIVKRDEMQQSFAGHAGVGLFSRWRAYRVTEEPLCQPSIYLALLEMASYELWVREKVEGTFLAFHA